MDRHGPGLDLPRDLFCGQIFVRTLVEDSRIVREIAHRLSLYRKSVIIPITDRDLYNIRGEVCILRQKESSAEWRLICR